MTHLRLIVVCFFTVFLAGSAHAQDSGLAFLRIGTNAAAMALGDAYVAHSRDAFATYWNPAGLAAAKSNMAALSHHVWVADVRTYAFATRFQAGASGAIGLFATGTGSGDLEARDGPGDPDGLFSTQFVSAGASYGRRLGPVRAGLTAKYISERIYTDNSSGYAFDFGLQADLFDGVIQLGSVVQNLGKMNKLETEQTTLPRLVRAGIAVFPIRILAEDDNTRLLNTFITSEVSHLLTDDADQSTRVHIGIAAEVMDLVVVRAGYLTNDSLRSYTFGGGLGFSSFVVDYAYVPFQSGFGDSGHVLTLMYQW